MLSKFAMRPALLLSQTVDGKKLVEAQLGALRMTSANVVELSAGQSPFSLPPPPAGHVQVVEMPDDVR